jgi:hypothetical protein
VSAPRKYLNKDRTKVSPEWMDWAKEQREQAADFAWRHVASLGYDPDSYFPELVDKAIPEEGAWILVIEEPFTELRSRFRVPLLSMWRARPHELNVGGIQVAKGLKIYPQQAIIATPGGDLHLWPHEYIVATNPMALAAEEGATLNSLGGDPVLNEDALFYLQSRGISYQDAALMLFDTIRGTDFMYVTFPEEVTEQLEGWGRSLRRHVFLNPRKAG